MAATTSDDAQRVHLANPLRVDEGADIPFDRIRAEHVEPAVQAALAEARRLLAALPDRPRTFDGVLGGLEAVTDRLERVVSVAEHLESVATTPELRAAFNAVQPDVSAFVSSIVLSERVWAAIKEYAATAEAKALTGVQRRFLDKTVADFKRSGADLDASGKKRLEAIDVELAQLTLKFGQNVLDATNAFDLVVEDRQRLAGLPESAVEAARESASAKGVAGYRLTLQGPSYLTAMAYLDDASIREALYRANGARGTRGEADNRPLVRRILELRHEKARLLGFASFADMVCEDRMAKTGDAARRFVASLRERTRPFFVRENEELVRFRRELEGADSPAMQPWDIAYYAEKLRRERYDFDDEALRPYFPLDGVVAGLFDIAERLYGLRIEAWPDAPAWNPAVRAYRVREPSGAVVAQFYADLFPREDKRDGAWMHGIVSALGPGERHLEILVANFTPPVGGAVALLRHREVETLFHEFGHLMHHGASRVPIRSLAGTSVARDFVELPSQIMENWCWEKAALDLFARHHETGAPIPDDLCARMQRARSFRAANAMMRQLGFAELDLALHVDWDPASSRDPLELANEILGRHAPVAPPPEHSMACSFSHLFASPVGYAAGYYSYKWAEVLDADAFSRFKHEGIFDRTVGTAFREHVLSRGDSEDPQVLYERFMGRGPRFEALLERDGLLPAEP